MEDRQVQNEARASLQAWLTDFLYASDSDIVFTLIIII